MVHKVSVAAPTVWNSLPKQLQTDDISHEWFAQLSYLYLSCPTVTQ